MKDLTKTKFDLCLSQRDQEIFFDALRKPQEPTARLKKAAAHYKELTSKKSDVKK